MYKLSSFNKIEKNILKNSITQRTIGYTEIVSKLLERTLRQQLEYIEEDEDNIIQLITAELLFQGFIAPQEFTISISEEKSYLEGLIPVTKPGGTFYGTKFIDFRCINNNSKNTIVFCGVPCDLGSSRPGTRFGPNLIRQESINMMRGYSMKDGYNLLDLNSNTSPLSKVNCYDIGDISLDHTDIKHWFNTTTQVLSSLPPGSLPIVIGGDHSFTFASIQATVHRIKKPFTLVQLDYHLDVQLWGEFKEKKPVLISHPIHSNFISWVKESFPDIEIYQLGVAGYLGIKNDKDIKCYLNNISKIITSNEINDTEHLSSILEKLPTGQQIYLTIDVDVIDRMIQTGYPSYLGLTFDKLLKIVKYLCLSNTLIGVDIMEFGKTSILSDHRPAARLLCYLILDIIKHYSSSFIENRYN